MQIVEFDVQEGTSAETVGAPLRDAALPPDSKVAAIIRGDRMLLPGGNDRSSPATASSSSARLRRHRSGAGCSRLARGPSATS